jgi:hypothetical protein
MMMNRRSIHLAAKHVASAAYLNDVHNALMNRFTCIHVPIGGCRHVIFKHDRQVELN